MKKSSQQSRYIINAAEMGYGRARTRGNKQNPRISEQSLKKNAKMLID